MGGRHCFCSAAAREAAERRLRARAEQPAATHPGGMPKFEPTDEQRTIVERAAGFGLPQAKICQLVVSDRTGRPIDDTLRKAFRAVLDRGMALIHYKVGSSLVDNALNGNVNAQM